MKVKEKTAAQAPPTPARQYAAADEQLTRYAQLKHTCDAATAAAKEVNAPREAEMEQLLAQLKAYAESEAGKAAFGTGKTLKLADGALQWKTGKALVKGDAYDEVAFLAVVQKLAPAAISTTVVKAKLCSAWDLVGKLPAALTAVGVTVTTETTFHVLPAK